VQLSVPAQYLRNYSTNIPATAKIVRYETSGSPKDVLKFQTEPLPKSLKPSEVLIKILAAPINPADLNMVEGNYGIKPTLPAVGGNEGVGTVLEVGSNVKRLKPKDLVVPTKPGLGTWRDFGVFNETDFEKIPADIPIEYAACSSVNPPTALRLLEDFVKLKQGDVIIQNAANSSVGISVLQFARQRGLKTINIMRMRPDFDELVDQLKQLGGENTMVVSDEYITTPAFKRLMSDSKAPILGLNCVGGETATEMARILGNNGVLVTYGGMSRKPIKIPTSLFIFKNLQMKGFWLTQWLKDHSAEEREAMRNKIFQAIKSKDLTLFLETWEFDKFPAALERISDPTRFRKVVLKTQ